MREKLGEVLCDKITYICQNMNSDDYVPKMPDQKDVDLVFDTDYVDVQPYLHKVFMVLCGSRVSFVRCEEVRMSDPRVNVFPNAGCLMSTAGCADFFPRVQLSFSLQITYDTTGPSSASVGTTMRKFFKETLLL